MRTKIVTLSTGEEVTVYTVPPAVHDMIAKKHALPEPPIQEFETVSGKQQMLMLDDPEYLAEKARVEALRVNALQEAYTIFALKDVEAPKDFDVEAEYGDEIRFLDPDWKSREGKIGKRLDYIEYGLLANPIDSILVSNAMAELMSIDTEVIEQVEGSFRSQVEK